jgi:hypothetical protein
VGATEVATNGEQKNGAKKELALGFVPGLMIAV